MLGGTTLLVDADIDLPFRDKLGIRVSLRMTLSPVLVLGVPVSAEAAEHPGLY